MKLKKTIIISSYDDLKNPYYHGGGAICVHELAKELGKEFSVTVLTSRHKASSSDEAMDGVLYKRIGFTPDFFPPLGQFVFLSLLPFYAWRLKFDLWIESFTPPFSTAFLPLFTKKTVVGLVHFLSGKEMAKRYKLPFATIEAAGIKHYRHFITPNEVTAKELTTAVPSAVVTTIPNGVYLPATTNTHKREKVVSFLGRLEVAQKGLDLLVQAIAQVKNDKNWSYVIAGTGVASEEHRLKKQIADLNLTDKVKLVGRVSGKSKTELLEKTSIMIVPSRFETFSMVSLEALSYGIPLITFNIDGLKWLPKNGVLRTPAYDVTKLAQNIELLENDSKKRNLMGIANQKNASTYAWEHVIPQYQKVIGGLV